MSSRSFSGTFVVALFPLVIVGTHVFRDQARAGEVTVAKPRSTNEVETNVPGAELKAAGSEKRVVTTVNRPNWYVPKSVDSSDNKVRIALALPEGPLVIELKIWVEDRPFREAREDLIDEMLDAAPKDSEGQITWNAALKSAEFAGNRRTFIRRGQAQAMLKRLGIDPDEDGLVDRYETRLYLARMFGGPTLQTENRVTSYTQIAETALAKLVDTDGDSAISRDELDRIQQALKARDLDDNDIVDLRELTGQFSYGQRYRGGTTSPVPLAFHYFHDGTDWSLTSKNWDFGQRKTQESAESRPLAERWLAKLDNDGNGEIDETELSWILEVEPDVGISVNLASSKEQQALRLDRVDEHLKDVVRLMAADGDSMKLEVAGSTILWKCHNNLPTANFDANASAVVMRYDQDKNGYVDKAESERFGQGGSSQFTLWDADKDGKVFPEELVEFYKRGQRPQLSQVSLAGLMRRGSIFAALDANGDARLSLREMRSAADRIRMLDRDGNGALDRTEIPTTVSLAFARGPYARQVLMGRNLGGRAQTIARQAAPKDEDSGWFSRMDRNGDGDISRREFLGTDEQFEVLDTDQDGLIDRDESEGGERARIAPE